MGFTGALYEYTKYRFQPYIKHLIGEKIRARSSQLRWTYSNILSLTFKIQFCNILWHTVLVLHMPICLRWTHSELYIVIYLSNEICMVVWLPSKSPVIYWIIYLTVKMKYKSLIILYTVILLLCMCPKPEYDFTNKTDTDVTHRRSRYSYDTMEISLMKVVYNSNPLVTMIHQPYLCSLNLYYIFLFERPLQRPLHTSHVVNNNHDVPITHKCCYYW